jgi:serine/threonine-protein kinase RsbW
MPDVTPLREVRLILPMASDMELVASQTASAIASWMVMSAERVGEVEMAVVEACINAFEHSHSEERKVDITFRVFGAGGPERLEIRVHDRGIGFEPAAVADPQQQGRKLVGGGRKRGWGLRIIQGLMDEVRILSGSEGTTVVMSKSR